MIPDLFGVPRLRGLAPPEGGTPSGVLDLHAPCKTIACDTRLARAYLVRSVLVRAYLDAWYVSEPAEDNALRRHYERERTSRSLGCPPHILQELFRLLEE